MSAHSAVMATTSNFVNLGVTCLAKYASGVPSLTRMSFDRSLAENHCGRQWLAACMRIALSSSRLP